MSPSSDDAAWPVSKIIGAQRFLDVFLVLTDYTAQMDGEAFVKCLIDSGLCYLDGFTAQDADVVFARYKTKGYREIGLAEFCRSLAEIAKKVDLSEAAVAQALSIAAERHSDSLSTCYSPPGSRRQDGHSQADVFPFGPERNSDTFSTCSPTRSQPQDESTENDTYIGTDRVNESIRGRAPGPRLNQHGEEFGERLLAVFNTFAGTNEKMNAGVFTRIMANAGLLAANTLDFADVDEIFSAVKPVHVPCIDFTQFGQCVAKIAEMTGMREIHVANAICGPIRSTSPPAQVADNPVGIALDDPISSASDSTKCELEMENDTGGACAGRPVSTSMVRKRSSRKQDSNGLNLLVHRLCAERTEMLERAFDDFTRGTREMDNLTFLRCIRSVGLVGLGGMEISDVDVIFATYKPIGGRSLDFTEFGECLSAIAKATSLSEEDLVDLMCQTRVLTELQVDNVESNPNVTACQTRVEFDGAASLRVMDVFSRQLSLTSMTRVGRIFHVYTRGKTEMGNRAFVLCMRDAGMLDDDGLKLQDVDLIFASNKPKGYHTLDFIEFLKCLTAVACKLGTGSVEVVKKVCDVKCAGLDSDFIPRSLPLKTWQQGDAQNRGHCHRKFVKRGFSCDARRPVKSSVGYPTRSSSSRCRRPVEYATASSARGCYNGIFDVQRQQSSPSHETNQSMKSPLSPWKLMNTFADRHDARSLRMLQDVFFQFTDVALEMNCQFFVRCLRETGVLQRTGLRVAAAEVIFSNIPGGTGKSACFLRFCECLAAVANKTGWTEKQVLQTVCRVGGLKRVGPERFFHDVSTYTETHRQGGPSSVGPAAPSQTRF